MAQNKNAAEFDEDMELALQEALESDLAADAPDPAEAGDPVEAGATDQDTVDLDSELSLDDFEAQVAKAADELGDVNTASADAGTEASAPVAPAPIPARPASATAGLRPANDDSAEREYAQILERLNAGASNRPVVWATLISLLWIAGAAGIAHLL